MIPQYESQSNSVTRFSLVLLFLKRIGRILQQEFVFPAYSIMVYISVSNIPSISCQVIDIAGHVTRLVNDIRNI